MSEEKKTIVRKETGGSKDKFWNPRFWDGATVSVWFKALAAGKGRCSLSRVPMGLIVTLLSPFNSTCAFCQRLFFGKRIRRQELAAPPIFILGHWRSGTTLLHEYLIRDDRFTFADTFTCFAPSHFLFSRKWLSPMVGFLMPKKRPMDNMAAGLSRPQEDEFALCALGVPSPYLNILFPNNPPIRQDYLTLRDVSEADREKWLDAFEGLLKALTVAEPKTVVLKSPPHTGRIRTLLKRFPDAKFIYIHRNPYVLFPSTFNLWIKLSKTHGLQIPKEKGLAEKVLSDFEKMDAAYVEDRSLLKEGQLSEIAFDDLTSDPVAVMEKIYSDIGLDGFENVRETFEAFAGTQKNYKKNRFEIPPEIAEAISRRWRGYLDRYHYENPAPS